MDPFPFRSVDANVLPRLWITHHLPWRVFRPLEEQIGSLGDPMSARVVSASLGDSVLFVARDTSVAILLAPTQPAYTRHLSDVLGGVGSARAIASFPPMDDGRGTVGILSEGAESDPLQPRIVVVAWAPTQVPLLDKVGEIAIGPSIGFDPYLLGGAEYATETLLVGKGDDGQTHFSTLRDGMWSPARTIDLPFDRDQLTLANDGDRWVLASRVQNRAYRISADGVEATLEGISAVAAGTGAWFIAPGSTAWRSPSGYGQVDAPPVAEGPAFGWRSTPSSRDLIVRGPEDQFFVLSAPATGECAAAVVEGPSKPWIVKAVGASGELWVILGYRRDEGWFVRRTAG